MEICNNCGAEVEVVNGQCTRCVVCGAKTCG